MYAPLSKFIKKLHRRYLLCILTFYIRLCFLKTLETFYFFKMFYTIRLLKSVISLKYFASFYSSNIVLEIQSLSHLTYWILFYWIQSKPCNTCSTTMKYCYKQALNKKLELMGGTMKYFLKKLLGHEIFRSMVTRATKNFLKNL